MLFDIRICFVLRYSNFIFAALPHEASSVATHGSMVKRLLEHCYG